MVKMVVGVCNTPYRLIRQTLAERSGIAAAVTAVYGKRLVFPFQKIKIVSVACNLPCARRNELRLIIRYIHWKPPPLFVLQKHLMLTGKIYPISALGKKPVPDCLQLVGMGPCVYMIFPRRRRLLLLLFIPCKENMLT